MSSRPAVELPSPSTLDQKTLPAESQGIVGTVQRLSGNHMPGSSPSQNGQATELVSTQVWIFSGKVQNMSPRWALAEAREHPGLIGWVASDAEGRFAVGLPEGEYTVLAQYEEDLYLNSFQGDGSYSSVEVTEDQTTEVDLVNSENAVF
ncbi:carboxypeptidase-like regulatory domain-containing protein [cf. Phormidesmis sp. LEGE 11477]|uniref:carboxypeptidase-like regulatory domain-containing protein n=1 Tax=cf. Phormidesmis sp. LEGE 11477 TaxID=1828680 RepID=UPI00188089A8|nr:carboxypeptidase-like regulatory domain-containing protein [cf. Phormidesmis sp. LEGE 11477]MBE9059705.1 carboxypeptidase regulatory-like domain-containing protein [cf. Phormidesmis sp. LEGE 11477]